MNRNTHTYMMKRKAVTCLLSCVYVLASGIYSDAEAKIRADSPLKELVKSQPSQLIQSQENDEHGSDIFGDEAQLVSNSELDKVRGTSGLFTPSGVMFDFILSSKTTLDGDLIDETRYNLSNVADQAKLASEIERIISISSDGTPNVTTQSANTDTPQLLIAIQTSLDNTAIDHITTLDVNVQNMSNFITQTQQFPQLNNQIVGSLN